MNVYLQARLIYERIFEHIGKRSESIVAEYLTYRHSAEFVESYLLSQAAEPDHS